MTLSHETETCSYVIDFQAERMVPAFTPVDNPTRCALVEQGTYVKTDCPYSMSLFTYFSSSFLKISKSGLSSTRVTCILSMLPNTSRHVSCTAVLMSPAVSLRC